MRVRQCLVIGGALAGLAGLAVAWQGTMSTLGWTEADKKMVARSFLLNGGTMNTLPGVWELKPLVKRSWGQRPAADRVALVRELAAAAKAMVSTPAFLQTYNGWIKEGRNAVDHGMKVDDQTQMQRMTQPGAMDEVMREAGVEIYDQFITMQPDAIKMMLEMDLPKWSRARDAKTKALAARGESAKALLATNPNEARRQYALAKCVEMGGPESPEEMTKIRQAAGQRKNREKWIEEQRAYNEYNLKTVLKKRLTEFVAEARSVDFAAETKAGVRGKRIFANPAYERKSAVWKQMYRLGKEPTLAAADAAEKWLREM